MAWGAPPIKGPAKPAGKTGGFGYKIPAGLRPNAGLRQSAVAQHMGAPKTKAPPQHKEAPKKPPQHKGGGGGHKGGGKPAGPPLGSSQKEIGTLNQGDVVNRARTEARLARNAELVPLQAQANEIKGNEAGVQANYAKLVGGENEQFQKIGEQQAASAKTFQNQMAENALQQGKAIETAGQTGASMTGGYASPELRAQLLGEAQLAGQQGGAGNQFAQNVATTGAANIANMRGAAALNALGGSQAVSNVFQKQLAGNQTAQQGVFAKTGLREVEGRTKLEQANLTDQFARQKLESEGAYKKGQLAIGAQNAATSAAKQKADAKYKKLMGNLGIEKFKGDQRQRKIDNQIKKGALKVSQLNAQDKAAYDKWKRAGEPGKPGGSKTYSSATAAKFQSDVGKVASKIVTLTEGKTHNQAELDAAWKKLRGEGIDDHVIHAAINKVRYNKFGPRDQAYMKSIGAER